MITARRANLEQRARGLGLELAESRGHGPYTTTAHWWVLRRTDRFGTWELYAGSNLAHVEARLNSFE